MHNHPFRERLYREALVINRGTRTAVIKAVLVTALFGALACAIVYTAVQSSHAAAVRSHMQINHPGHRVS